MDAHDQKVREWSERFRKAPLARSFVAGLHRRSAEIWQRTFDLLQKESPEYRNSVDEEFTTESRSHCRELQEAIIAVATGRADKAGGDFFEFVRTHAEWRARRQVPLIASLHAYRLAHKTYWGITQESFLQHPEREEALLALTMLSSFWIELFDHVGSVLADAHAVEERLSVAQNTRAYSGLMNDLVRGLEPRGAEAQRLRTLCGIRPGGLLAVVVARPLPSSNEKPADLEVILRSLVRLFQQALPASIFGKLVDSRNGEVRVIACSDSDTGRRLLKALRRHGFGRRSADGLGVRLGVSLDTTQVSCLPERLEEAQLALEFAGASRPLMHFADIDLSEFLIRRADKTALRLLPEWTRQLTPPHGGPSGQLSRTIHAFADCSLNVKQTARRLGVHTNTVYFRLNRICKLSGVVPRTFSGTSYLLAAL
jgi:hypothetical protein